ncbi:transposase [Allosphingosinicella flava]|uniref:Transposase n=1 Tax=Allosphingosinicella flava TaxID=2771430 RepID=A0A7T2GK29_9SPHN|nr:transposase [Sphingosinicella flava]QPQ55317.1 transposase [Sphingosinicella flava]
MPRIIQSDTADTIELAELVEALEMSDFDPRDEDCFASWGEMLKKLANNRSFLSDLIISELKGRFSEQKEFSDYNSQVMMLYNRSNRFAIRANFWPALTDQVVKYSGTRAFLYNVAHNHNFSFLTVGYLGPGYWSDYYECNYEQIIGYDGEKVDLTFIEKARLEPGKVMLYRKHKDVHRQLPADAMSVSLNIMEPLMGGDYIDQYGFDIESGRISTIMNWLRIEPLLALSAHFGGEKGKDLLHHYAARHPSSRVRMSAINAQAGVAGDLDARIELFEQAARSSDAYVSAMAAKQAHSLERGRTWLERQV